MKIYEAEKRLDLDEMITASAIVECSAAATVSDKLVDAEEYFRNEENKEWYSKHIVPSDIMLTHAILVTNVWNKNDDVFDSEELWEARYTPIFKPVNINHKGREAVNANTNLGVIYESFAVDDEYKPIYVSDTDDLPDKFHILVGMYVWESYFPTATKEIRDKIDNDKMFVSMECLIKDFGYALRKSEDDEVLLLPRNEITAWMSAHLRRFKGSGKITINNTEYQIGRWLKDYQFSGVAFVDTPANPESIVFEDYISHAAASMTVVDEENISDFAENSVSKISKRENTWLI